VRRFPPGNWQGASLRVSKLVQSGGVYCKDKGVDEKDFYSIAHEQ
jgi:hypothetical protein